MLNKVLRNKAITRMVCNKSVLAPMMAMTKMPIMYTPVRSFYYPDANHHHLA